MAMQFFSNRGEEIHGFEDWERLAPPASAIHAKDDRSARELARAWMCGTALTDTSALLSTHPDLAPTSFERGVAEKRTQFDEIPQGRRSHDLLLVGDAGVGRIVVGVEGKADETFGETLAQYRDRTRSPKSRALERLDRLTNAFFGAALRENSELGTIRYQLCSAMAGTLADARTERADAAVLLVHEFRTWLTDDRRHEENAKDLARFLDHLDGDPPVHSRGEGWIAGPWTLRGDGERLPVELPAYAGKLVTELRDPAV